MRVLANPHIRSLRDRAGGGGIRHLAQVSICLLFCLTYACSFDVGKLRAAGGQGKDAGPETSAAEGPDVADSRDQPFATGGDGRAPTAEDSPTVIADLASSLDAAEDFLREQIDVPLEVPLVDARDAQEVGSSAVGTGGTQGGGSGGAGPTGGSSGGGLGGGGAAVDAGADSGGGGTDGAIDAPRAGAEAGGHDVGIDSAEAGPACNGHVGPVAYYACESASGNTLPDSSGNGRNATLAGDYGYASYGFAAGKVGNALDLSSSWGGGYAKLPANLLSTACEATVASWVYLYSKQAWQRVFDFGKDTNSYMFLTNSSEGNRMRFAITSSGYWNEQLVEGTSALPVGSWHHVAIVLGSNGGTLYLDGVQIGSNAAMTLRPSDVGVGSAYYLGRSQYAGDPYLDGMIDELRIYDRALSASEIQTLVSAQ